MNLKSLTTSLIILASSSGLFAQQDPIYSQYLSNPLLINPAYAGLNNSFNASLSYRNQWTGFDGNPVTVNAGAHSSFMDNRVGGGALLLQDKYGVTKNTEFQAMGSYKLDLEHMTLSVGMQLGLINFRNDFSKLVYDPDPAFGQNENITKPNLGAGAILKSDRFLIGLSVPRLLKTTISGGGQDFQLYNSHLYLVGAYVYHFNERVRLKPSVLVRKVKGTPLSTDINFNINLDARYTAGIYTRNFGSWGLLLQGWFFEKYRLGYTFETPTSKSLGTGFISHEITMGLRTAIFLSHDRSMSEF